MQSRFTINPGQERTIYSYKYTCVFPEGGTDLLHLSGSHIVCVYNETLWVLIQKLLIKRNKQRFKFSTCVDFFLPHSFEKESKTTAEMLNNCLINDPIKCYD